MNDNVFAQIGDIILKIVSQVPGSTEKALSDDPDERVQQLIATASWKAAAVSGTLALPPGPVALLTVLPDLVAIWKIQGQLVSDIAAVYGQRAKLNREEMIYCLFRHGAAVAMRDVVTRVGERYLVQRASAGAIEKLATKVGTEVGQRVVGRGFTRWIPLAGAVAIAWYAKHDTRKVGETARDFFSHPIVEKPVHHA